LPLAYDKTVLHGSDYVVEETTHIVAKTWKVEEETDSLSPSRAHH
jgi:hypothetical protein